MIIPVFFPFCFYLPVCLNSEMHLTLIAYHQVFVPLQQKVLFVINTFFFLNAPIQKFMHLFDFFSGIWSNPLYTCKHAYEKYKFHVEPLGHLFVTPPLSEGGNIRLIWQCYLKHINIFYTTNNRSSHDNTAL